MSAATNNRRGGHQPLGRAECPISKRAAASTARVCFCSVGMTGWEAAPLKPWRRSDSGADLSVFRGPGWSRRVSRNPVAADDVARHRVLRFRADARPTHTLCWSKKSTPLRKGLQGLFRGEIAGYGGRLDALPVAGGAEPGSVPARPAPV